MCHLPSSALYSTRLRRCSSLVLRTCKEKRPGPAPTRSADPSPPLPRLLLIVPAVQALGLRSRHPLVEKLVYLKRSFTLGAMLFAAGVAGCDKDPSSPEVSFALSACPAGNLAVNSPINLEFTSRILASTVSSGNVVVTDATTGVEIPGALSLGSSGSRVIFTPSSTLPFGTVLGIRVQNLLSSTGTVPLAVTVCNVRTAPPPIAEVVWDRLPSPTGTQLLGASLVLPDSGWVASFAVPLYRRVGAGWEPRFTQPYFAASYDVAFVSLTHGYGAHFDTRNLRAVITQTVDGTNFDTVFTVRGQDIRRLRIDSVNSNGRLFGVGGGGSSFSARFLKLNSATSFVSSSSFGVTAQVADIDFAKNDTTALFAVSNGTRFVSGATYPGRLFMSGDGGQSWAQVANASADSLRVVTYSGVARRANGDVYVSGGNGYFARFAGGVGPGIRINLGVLSRDTTDYTALIYRDVQFAPDNNLVGWVIGAELTGITNGVPQFRGLIFGTKDGGLTWTRQGVRGANQYGAEFPALNRLSVFSATKAWAVGDGGTVISVNQ